MSPADTAAVLIIEDDPAVADATKLLLELEGFDILTAATLEDALAKVSTAGMMPEIIISDFHLNGGVTGVDAIRGVREALQCEIPAMLVTGDTSSHMVDALQEVSACTLLCKPVNTEALLSRIDQLIARSPDSANFAASSAPAS